MNTSIFLWSVLSGLVSSFLYGWTSRNRPLPRYHLKSKKYNDADFLIETINTENEIAIRNTVIDKAITEIAFWNEGNIAIKGSDINPINPVGVRVFYSKDNYSFQKFSSRLSANVFRATDHKNTGFNLTRSCQENSVFFLIDFVEMKSGDGVIIQVSHDTNMRVAVEGAIIGIGDVKKHTIIESMDVKWFFLLYLSLIFYSLSYLIFYAYILIYNSLVDFQENLDKPLRILILFMIYGFFFEVSFFAGLKFWWNLRNMPPEVKEHFKE